MTAPIRGRSTRAGSPRAHARDRRAAGPARRSGAPIPFRSIGVVRSPHQVAAGTPIQPAFAEEVEGEIVLDEALAPALADLDGFDRIWLICWLDRAPAFRPRVVPFRDVRKRGLFATRAPCRPNAVGLSVVRLLGRRHNVLRVAGLDLLDGTPVIDVKPYVPEFDAHPSSAAGWFDARTADRRVDDGRFAPISAGRARVGKSRKQRRTPATVPRFRRGVRKPGNP